MKKAITTILLCAFSLIGMCDEITFYNRTGLNFCTLPETPDDVPFRLFVRVVVDMVGDCEDDFVATFCVDPGESFTYDIPGGNIIGVIYAKQMACAEPLDWATGHTSGNPEYGCIPSTLPIYQDQWDTFEPERFRVTVYRGCI